jgi:hypothetical protein
MLRGKDRWCAAGMLAVVGVLLSGPGSADDRGKRPPEEAPDRPMLVHLWPGTSVAAPRPAGWTDRVIRSAPRLASGELDTLPGSAARSATLFRTVILADVASGAHGYVLRRVGIGNAVPFEGREVVVTADGPKEVRAALSTIERIVANAADAELRRGRIVASTPTFALFRGPTHLALAGRHRDVDVNYAILVDPATGVLQTLIWSSLPGNPDPPRTVTSLDPDLAFDCRLDVAVSARVGPLPLAWSFAMAALPPGRTVEVPVATARTFNGEDPEALESLLRDLSKRR